MRHATLAIALLLTACGSAGTAPTAPPSATGAGELDLDGTWQLTAGTDVPIVDDYPITLTFTGSEVGGTSACNEYGGRVARAGGTFSIGELGGTDMACKGDVMAAEAAYLAALREVAAIAREGEELVLSGPDAELRFSRLAEPPTAELVEHLWVLETLVVGDVATPAMGERATLELSTDGTFTGSTGCRTFEGQWLERGNQILATSMAMNEEACPPELQQQDGHVVSVVGDGFVPTIEGGLLTLTDPGSIGLVYRVAD